MTKRILGEEVKPGEETVLESEEPLQVSSPWVSVEEMKGEKKVSVDEETQVESSAGGKADSEKDKGD